MGVLGETSWFYNGPGISEPLLLTSLQKAADIVRTVNREILSAREDMIDIVRENRSYLSEGCIDFK